MVRHCPWSALSCVSAPKSLYYPVPCGQELVRTQSSWVVDWVRKRVIGQPGSLWATQRRRSILCGCELREQIFVSLLSCSYLVLVDLTLFCPDLRRWVLLVLEITCRGIYDSWWTFDSNRFLDFVFNFESRSYLVRVGTSFTGSEVPTGLIISKNLSSFSGSPIHGASPRSFQFPSLVYHKLDLGTRIGQQLGQVLWTFIQHCYLWLTCVP